MGVVRWSHLKDLSFRKEVQTPLRKKIKEKFKTFGAFSLAMDIPYQRMSNLLTDKADWRREEVYKAAELLGILDSVNEYFFTVKSQKQEIPRRGK